MFKINVESSVPLLKTTLPLLNIVYCIFMMQHRIIANNRLLQENNCEGDFKNTCTNENNETLLHLSHPQHIFTPLPYIRE